MAKTKISEFSSTPANNTDIDSINIAEGCAPSGINDAIRELMAQLKDFQTGAVGDSFNGPIGSSTASTGAFTNITASGTLGVTGVATLGAGAILNTPASVTLTNATGLPISTGVSGLGTGVATALAVNTGSAGAPVLFNGALGTPSSGTVTNLTGTASININGTVGATTPTTGAFTTLAASSTVTLSGGTANGVAYLNGSKVVTSGSALTFDGTNLGVGGTATSFGAGYPTLTMVATSGAGIFQSKNTAGDARFYAAADGNVLLGSWANTSIQFYQNSLEAMRLTSTGLGIGTSSPTQRLHLAIGSATAIYNRIQNSAGDCYLGLDTSGNTNLSADNTGNQLIFKTEAVERMRLDTSGNLGLGVTPSAWDSLFKVIQFGGGAFLGQYNANALQLGLNTYFNGSNYIYTTTNEASRFVQSDGQFQWFTAPSGTAGNAITFTQAMTLDASGNLGVGTTSASSRLHLANAGDVNVRTQNTTAGTVSLYGSDGTGTYAGSFSNHPVLFYTNSTERARIDSSGNLVVNGTSAGVVNNNAFWTSTSSYFGQNHANGTASGTNYIYFGYNAGTIGSITQSGTTAVLYNVTSDQRLKENIVDAPEFGSVIDSIQVRSYDWKSDGSHQRAGFIAQELVTVAPEAVHQPEDTEQMMAVDYSKLVPMLVKEIQSLRKRLADAGL